MTFIDPTPENGAYVFARIADELGRLRPDISLLVVEGRGSEADLASCGLDLRVHGNVNLIPYTPDPRRFLGVTRACLVPSPGTVSQTPTIVAALIDGIPVIASNRGSLPETLGDAGVILPLPDRITATNRLLPTAEEVAPWVEAIIRLWDDDGWYQEQRDRASAQGYRWALQTIEVHTTPGLQPAAPERLQTALSPSPEHSRLRPDIGQRGGPSIEAGIAAIERRWPDVRNDSDDDPIFILAAGWRSGSTMLQRLIFRSCFLWGEPFGHAGLIESLADQLRCFNDDWPQAHHFYAGADAESLSKTFIANLYPSIQDLLRSHQAFFQRLFAEPARHAGASRWGLKEVRLGVEHAAYLKWLFPRARFLFLIRNPYDAWRSYATRAAKGWTWFRRWPDEPVTVRSFAGHWRQLVTSFLDDHGKVHGLLVRYEDLKRGDYAAIERYLGFTLSREAGQTNPSDGGPPPLNELLDSDRAALEEELGPLAASLGYGHRTDRIEPTGRAEPNPVEAIPQAVPSDVTQPAEAAANGPSLGSAADPAKCVVLVPVGQYVEPACDDALRDLERRGYTIRRVRGYSAIDQGRNQIATDALRDGFEELMWIDSDVAFDPAAVERLRAHGLPITCAIYPKKGRRSFACNFPGGTKQVVFGKDGGLIEVPYAGAGFLHTRREVYRSVQERFRLPECNERFGPSMVPYFQPLVIPDGTGHWYLAEDFSFCHRARECGYQIIADTTIRLLHIGTYTYSWEDAGGERQRYANFTFNITD